MGGFDAMKVYNFGGKDKHLDPPDIPDEQPLIYFRCDICSGVFLLGDGSVIPVSPRVCLYAK